MAEVEVIGIDKSYGALRVLRSVSLAVDKGEFIVLLGPSGCGKSTLLNAIAGLDEVDAGTIAIGGRDVTACEPRDRGIAMVFQSYALYPSMTVAQNLGFGLRMGGLPRAEVAARVRRAAALLQIETLLDRRPSQLSGGQRQRVAIGRAIARDARVYLFDEPLSNLDAQLRAETRVELKRLHGELGATAIYVTHDQVEAMTMATRIAIMNAGRLVQLDTPQAIYDRPADLFVAGFIGSPPMNLLPVTVTGGRGAFAIRRGEWRLDLPSGAAVAGAGDLIMGIRPEHLRLVPFAIEADGMPADLLTVEPLGSETLAWFQSGDRRVCVRLSPEQGTGLPARAAMVPDPHRISLFDPATGARLAHHPTSGAPADGP